MSNSQARQLELFSGEDWTVLYRGFTQINFNAYDPPSINAALKEYLQVHYPEDFNDWIESSEFVAIIDLLSWLAGSLAFRVDVNARENFLETAKARESILRLARFLSYSPRRSHSARGLVKITRVSTTESVIDSMGVNLQNQRISWNDPDNQDWFEHFSLIFNSAMPQTNPFGIPYKKIQFQTGDTQLYKLNTAVNSACVYPFNASVEGTNSEFELVNLDISTGEGFFERSPNPSNGFHAVYRNDGRGNASERTGFFMMFKQGSLRQSTYDIVNAIENRVLDIPQNNVNETDVWVQSLDDQLVAYKDWTKVPAIFSDNITYTGISADIRDIFSVTTRDNDQISLRFSDGRFGNVPVGNVRAWYRTANGMQYDLKPKDMENITVTMPYLDVNGRNQTLTVTFSLQETVANAVATETLEQVRRRAPKVYGTQNRMVSGEDYNMFPLSTNLIVKLRSVNRVYSGHSRFIDINDPTATYQDLIVLAGDGMLYREDSTQYTQVSTSANVTNDQIINQKIIPMLREVEVRNFMEDNFGRVLGGFTGFPFDFSKYQLKFNNTSSIQFNSLGTFSIPTPTTGNSSDFNLLRTFLIPGAKVKFKWNGGTEYRWAQVQTAAWSRSSGKNYDDTVTLKFDDVVPNEATMSQIIPQFRDLPTNQIVEERFDDGNSPIYSNLNGSMVSEITQLKYFIQNKLPFSLYYRYDSNSTQLYGGKILSGQWIAQAQNAVVSAPPNSVEVLRGQFINNQFWVLQTVVGMKYVFESVAEMRWPWLENHKVIDGVAGTDKRDTISVLWADHWTGVQTPINFDIVGNIYDPDGYPDPRKIIVAPADLDDDSEQDDPGSFDLVAPVTWKTYSRVGSVITSRPDIKKYILESDVIIANHRVDELVFVQSRNGMPYFGKVKVGNSIDWFACVPYKNTFAPLPDTATVVERNARIRLEAEWSDVWIHTSSVGTFMASGSKKWLIYKIDLSDTYQKQTPITNIPVISTILERNELAEINQDQIVFLAYLKVFLEVGTNIEHQAELSQTGGGWYQSDALGLVAKDEGMNNLKFQWKHYAGTDVRIDPAPTNIIDTFVLTTDYDYLVRQWLKEGANPETTPEPPTALDLSMTFSSFNQYKMFSDEIVWRPVKYKYLFGPTAEPDLRAQFKIVKLPNSILSDGEIRTKVIAAVNEYFDVNRWEFGETFFYTELAAYIHMQLVTAISSVVIVPLSDNGKFGNLFEVRCMSNEMFLSTAQVSDVVIIDGNTMANLRIK